MKDNVYQPLRRSTLYGPQPTLRRYLVGALAKASSELRRLLKEAPMKPGGAIKVGRLPRVESSTQPPQVCCRTRPAKHDVGASSRVKRDLCVHQQEDLSLAANGHRLACERNAGIVVEMERAGGRPRGT